MALVDAKDIRAWVRGYKLTFRPYLLVMGDELVLAKKGLLGSRVIRVPRDKVISSDYHDGFFMDKLTIKFGGDEHPKIELDIHRVERLEGQHVVDELGREEEE
mgnify:CR=1 FL=1